ncbi:MAG: phosphomannomutase/phosphoglucomutase [bacterium]|nr:phosphomannomutase/phosphoglucomutase [bacterium]
MDTNIFREYDIRGIVGEQLTDETVVNLTRALGTFFARNGARRIAIGYDARESSLRFYGLLTEALIASGLEVMQIGMVPTPVLYHTVHTKEVDGGVMITGSHNPAHHNGFKIALGKKTLFGEQIQEIKRIALEEIQRPAREQGRDQDMPLEAETRPIGKASSEEVLDDYVTDITAKLDFGTRKLKVVVDGGNGMGGVTAVPAYKSLGVELIELFVEPDAAFPNHHPDPTVEENLQDLIAAVREHSADVGLAFDGDGDRIGVVDETGRIIWGDELMILLSREILAVNPGATIIAEVKCSQNLYDDIERCGGTAIMERAGHSIIKSAMQRTGALLAGEMSGHIFFADRFYGFDDATYAGARLLEILSKTDKPLSQLFEDIPKTFSTPELRIDCPDDIKVRVVAKVAEHFKQTHKVITIDGGRILFDHGWGLVRASNTQAILVMRFEADTEQHLDEIRSTVEEVAREAIVEASVAHNT